MVQIEYQTRINDFRIMIYKYFENQKTVFLVHYSLLFNFIIVVIIKNMKKFQLLTKVNKF